MRTLIKFFALILALGGIVFPVYAFASSNSSTGASGEGASSVSGWAVSNISYNLSDETARVTSVMFDLDAPAKQVSVKLVPSAREFTACWNVGAHRWQCNFPADMQVSSMDEFRVIAAGN